MDGVAVENLRQLRQLVEDAAGPFVTFRLHGNRFLAVDVAGARAAAPRINAAHRIPAMMSPDIAAAPDTARAT